MTVFALTVAFRLHPGRLADFLPLVRGNARASVAGEPGCLRFDVCLPDDAEDEVVLYELYADRAAFDAHLATPHFAAFDVGTRDMVADKVVRSFRAEPLP